jgi:hypothetical protein
LNYRLLETFRELFDGKTFRHRASTQGDQVAIQFFEDLYELGRSQKYLNRVNSRISVLNVANTRVGVPARRGDGTFGEIVPNETAIAVPTYVVKRGPIATIEIGIEVKIVQKAIIRQIGRVISDLKDQVEHFKRKRNKPITIGVVGINHAMHYVSYEEDRAWPTTGKGRHKHPFQEAAQVEQRLRDLAAPFYDEFLLLHFIATNEAPFGLTKGKLSRTMEQCWRGSALCISCD